MKITQVTFRNDINIGPISTNFIDLIAGKREHQGITVVEKGNFLIIAGIPNWAATKRKRVPMSNVVEINEVEDDVVPTKGKEDSGLALTGATGSLKAGPTPPPLPAARVTTSEPAS